VVSIEDDVAAKATGGSSKAEVTVTTSETAMSSFKDTWFLKQFGLQIDIDGFSVSSATVFVYLRE